MVSFKCEVNNSWHDLIPNPRISYCFSRYFHNSQIIYNKMRGLPLWKGFHGFTCISFPRSVEVAYLQFKEFTISWSRRCWMRSRKARFATCDVLIICGLALTQITSPFSARKKEIETVQWSSCIREAEKPYVWSNSILQDNFAFPQRNYNNNNNLNKNNNNP